MEDSGYHARVYAVVRQIPKGRVTTYGAIADYLALGSARMVGWALHQSQLPDAIPAHRVVNRKGELSGRNAFPYPTFMQEMLENEGIKIHNNQVVQFEALCWHPQSIP